MSIERLRAHYGFTKMPFSKDIAPGALHRSAGHQEAVARVGFLVQEQVVGVVTGEVGRARPSPCGRPSRPSIRPGTPSSIWPTRPSVSGACTRRS